MLRTLTRSGLRDLIWSVTLLCAAAALMAYPQQTMEAGRQGLALCANVIIPSLFPFFVLSSMVVESGMACYLGRALERLMYPLFRINGTGACALVLGFIGGYPVGARTAVSLYESGLCSKTQAQRLLAFCNNSGPAFILGVVGTGVFGSGKIGLLLYLSHIAASLCIGLLFRFYGKESSCTATVSPPQIQTVSFPRAFTRSIQNSVSSVLNICAFVVLFTVVIRLLSLCGIMGLFSQLAATLLAPIGFDRQWAEKLLTGLLEISSGVTSLSGTGTLTGQISMSAFMLGWAGLSVHCQVLSFIADSALQANTYLLGKALHGTLSSLFIFLFLRLFPLSQPTSGSLSQHATRLSEMDFERALFISSTSAWLLWLIFLAVSVRALTQRKKRGDKSLRRAV